MSEEEFLARWSRRKLEARADIAPPETAERGEPQSTPLPPTTEAGQPEFDLSNLPSIDSITAGTDITAFLRKGVPQELIRAALRRAWSADPAIRDFVGLAENAWDFNDPNAMPGFGPLDCSQAELEALVDRLVGGLRKAAETRSDTPTDSRDSANAMQEPDRTPVTPVAQATDQDITSVPAAPQPIITEQGKEQGKTEQGECAGDPVRRRTHGGALPR